MERVASRKALLYILHAPTGMDERILANNRRGIADDCKLLDFFPWYHGAYIEIQVRRERRKARPIEMRVSKEKTSIPRVLSTSPRDGD